MIERFFLITSGAWLLMNAWAALRVVWFSIGKRLEKRKWGDGSGDQKQAVVILAVKGLDPRSTPRFFDSMLGQDYPNYRVIICFEHWEEPVAQWLAGQLEISEEHPVWINLDKNSGLRSVTLVGADLATSRGQKVHNQLAAIELLTDEDKIVVFADADIHCDQKWLAMLTAPINRGTHSIATTYRWLVPKRPTVPNQFASVINASVATQGGSDFTSVLWGGSMTMERKVFDSLNVPELFKGSLNDDLRLSKEARKQGHRIAFIRSLVLPTLVDFDWRGFFEFARRQYVQFKIFSPIFYRISNVVLGFYMFGLATVITGLVVGYFPYAHIAIAAAFCIDQVKAIGRICAYHSLYKNEAIRRKLGSTALLEHLLTPVYMTLHWIVMVSVWFKHHITWAGISYRINSASETKVLKRSSDLPVVPDVVPNLELYRRSHLTILPSESLKTEQLDTAKSGKVAPEQAPGTTTKTEPVEPVSQPDGKPVVSDEEKVADSHPEEIVPFPPVEPQPEPDSTEPAAASQESEPVEPDAEPVPALTLDTQSVKLPADAIEEEEPELPHVPALEGESTSARETLRRARQVFELTSRIKLPTAPGSGDVEVLSPGGNSTGRTVNDTPSAVTPLAERPSMPHSRSRRKKTASSVGKKRSSRNGSRKFPSLPRNSHLIHTQSASLSFLSGKAQYERATKQKSVTPAPSPVPLLSERPAQQKMSGNRKARKARTTKNGSVKTAKAFPSLKSRPQGNRR